MLELQLYSQRDIRLMLVVVGEACLPWVPLAVCSPNATLVARTTQAQQLWDMGEGAGWLRSMNQSPQRGCPPKSVILQCAMGDAQVTSIGGHIQARAYGAYTLHPQLRPVYGVPEVVGPVVTHNGNASVLVEYQFDGVGPDPKTNTPAPRATDTHECIKNVVAAQRQFAEFYDTGVVRNFCTGPPDGATCRVAKCPWHGWDKQVATGGKSDGSGLF